MTGWGKNAGGAYLGEMKVPKHNWHRPITWVSYWSEHDCRLRWGQVSEQYAFLYFSRRKRFSAISSQTKRYTHETVSKLSLPVLDRSVCTAVWWRKDKNFGASPAPPHRPFQGFFLLPLIILLLQKEVVRDEYMEFTQTIGLMRK
jgi:hypothetical protein